MKILPRIIFIVFSVLLILYLILPNPPYPEPPPDALQSNEPADTESPLRRAYFTDFTREQVMQQYESQLDRSFFLKVPLPTYRLNYPPEEAQTIIRDQTRSTFLEEVVHPFRESVFVNGFEPKDPKDAIFISERHWRQKIIVRFVPSSPVIRLAVAIPTLFLLFVIFRNWQGSARKIFGRGKNA